jgi:hypothetical protein
LLNDFLGDNADGELHAFVLLHGSVEVEILDVSYHEVGIRGGDPTVEEALCGCKFGGGSADGARVVKEIADSELGAMRFRIIWADCGNNASLGYFTARGDLVFADPPDGFGTMRHGSNDPLG